MSFILTKTARFIQYPIHVAQPHLPGTTDELANIHSYVSPTNSNLRDKHHTTSAQGTSRDVTPRPE